MPWTSIRLFIAILKVLNWPDFKYPQISKNYSHKCTNTVSTFFEIRYPHILSRSCSSEGFVRISPLSVLVIITFFISSPILFCLPLCLNSWGMFVFSKSIYCHTDRLFTFNLKVPCGFCGVSEGKCLKSIEEKEEEMNR